MTSEEFSELYAASKQRLLDCYSNLYDIACLGNLRAMQALISDRLIGITILHNAGKHYDKQSKLMMDIYTVCEAVLYRYDRKSCGQPSANHGTEPLAISFLTGLVKTITGQWFSDELSEYLETDVRNLARFAGTAVMTLHNLSKASHAR